jgi:hypothetical protein
MWGKMEAGREGRRGEGKRERDRRGRGREVGEVGDREKGRKEER